MTARTGDRAGSAVEPGADWNPTHCPRCGSRLRTPSPACDACGFDPARWIERDHLSLGSRDAASWNLALGVALVLLILFYVAGIIVLARSG